MANIMVLKAHHCTVCGVWVKNENQSFLRHYKEEHSSEGKGMFECPICLKNYSRKWTLTRHLTSSHPRIHTTLPAPSFVPNSCLTKPVSTSHWPMDFYPSQIHIRVFYGNNSPYPSCFQKSVLHPPRTLVL